jgi:hypothetical protein
MHEPMDKNRIRGMAMWDEWASDHEVHIHQVHGDVDPAVVCGRRSNLFREICRLPWNHG